MKRNTGQALKLRVVKPADNQPAVSSVQSMRHLLELADISKDRFYQGLPFTTGDATAGCETELQSAVVGHHGDVDLPVSIATSNYYKNIIRKAAAGETPQKAVSALERYLNQPPTKAWESSWVRFPFQLLGPLARRVLDNDLLADKQQVDGPKRCDLSRFFITAEGETQLRVPISYLLKLSLAEAIDAPGTQPLVRRVGQRLMTHFLNDNTSPETTSFYTSSSTGDGSLGTHMATETLLRYLTTQLLIQYANLKFELKQRGQTALIYFAPHPPIRLRQLNDLIPDAFYRELFMSPCLSGWDRGEDKHHYMVLCHQVLSRSQLNAVVKLKEADIITNNLVVLPNTSNISLANNGLHLSLGSRKLSALARDRSSGLTAVDEKYYGDLVIKIVEHFLPLFVGTYSAAPYRFAFSDFHPERVLGFLPHELDFTHLRMIWRRWKKKARITIFGRPLTPFGPQWLDRLISRFLALRGDFVADFRLIDYLVALLSTPQSGALNGELDSHVRVKRDLAEMGVFDTAMPMYLLYRQRLAACEGFCGFEGRYYSLFHHLGNDFARAADLQQFITVLAYQYILSGRIRHTDIPDDSFIESERRQIFFGRAIGIPTFFVRCHTTNRFMAEILKLTQKSRTSHRYPGYMRILNIEYQKALIRLIRRDAPQVIEQMGVADVISDLEARIGDHDGKDAADGLTRQILGGTGSPFDLPAETFNGAAERYYREALKKRHVAEGLAAFQKAVIALDAWSTWRQGYYNQALLSILKGKSALDFVTAAGDALINETLDEAKLVKLIHLALLVIDRQGNQPSLQ